MIGQFLCRHGWHGWFRVFGERHYHVQCRRCLAREVWPHFNRAAGYHPIFPGWARRGDV